VSKIKRLILKAKLQHKARYPQIVITTLGFYLSKFKSVEQLRICTYTYLSSHPTKPPSDEVGGFCEAKDAGRENVISASGPSPARPSPKPQLL